MSVDVRLSGIFKTYILEFEVHRPLTSNIAA